jgi:hypothetical protein
MRLVPVLLSLAALWPAGVAAQEQRSFTLPSGCTAHLTVQSRACQVTHHFTCEGDPEGWQRRVDLDMDGATYVGAIDAETQWMESFHIGAGHRERLEEAPRDPASFSALLADGTDTFDFRTLSDEVGTTRYVGFDTLTGVTTQIDGVTLEQTANTIMATGEDGQTIWQAQGNEWISREFRMFLSGVSEITTPDGTFEMDNSPVDLIRPGEPGFLSAFPKHGCGETVSALPGGTAGQG